MRLASGGIGLGLFLIIVCAGTVWGQVAQHLDEPREDWRYRRVFVPADRLESLAQGYLPMRAEEFLRRVRALDRAAAERRTGPDRAQYYAAWRDGERLEGFARLHISDHESPQRLVSLTPCAIFIEKPVWIQPPLTTPATLGTDAMGQVVALASGAGTLEFQWNVRPHQDESGQLYLPLQLPQAAITELILDLPQTVVPDVESGYAERIAEDPAPAPSVAQDLPELPARYRRWRIQSWARGGAGVLRLRSSEETTSSISDLIVMRQSDVYELDRGGIELRSTLYLDIHQQPIDHLELSVQLPLEITQIRYFDQPLDWTETHFEGETRIRIRFPNPIVGNNRLLQVDGLAPLPLDREFRLPKVSPQEVVWREAEATLNLSENLKLLRLTPIEGREFRVGPRPQGQRGESRELRFLSDRGAVALKIQMREPVLSTLQTTQLSIGSTALNAKVTAEISARHGEVFRVGAEIASSWVIDSVEADNEAIIEDYSVVTSADGLRQLLVTLRQPVSTQRAVVLTVRCHRNSLRVIRQTNFRPIDFHESQVMQRWVSLNPDPSLRLASFGDLTLQRLDPRNLPEKFQTRLDASARSFVFRDDEAARDLTVRTAQTQEGAGYTATVSTHATLDQQDLRETHRILCEPEAIGVTRLRIQLSQARETPLEWELLGQHSAIVQAERLEDNAGVPGESWELVFSRPLEETFELVGRRTTSFQGPVRLSLPALPAANSQTGMVKLDARPGTHFRVDSSNVKAVPTDYVNPERAIGKRKVFRYDPSRDCSIIVTPAQVSAAKLAWVRDLHLDAWLGSQGRVRSQARIQLENQGLSTLEVVLPADTELILAQWENASQPITPRRNKQGALQLTLPDDQRFPTLLLTYDGKLDAGGIRGTFQPRFPDLPLATLQRSWRFWLPPGYASVSPEAKLTLAQRLSGFWNTASLFDAEVRVPEIAEQAIQTLQTAFRQGQLRSGRQLLDRLQGIAPELQERIWIDTQLADRQADGDYGAPPTLAQFMRDRQWMFVCSGSRLYVTQFQQLREKRERVAPTSVPFVMVGQGQVNPAQTHWIRLGQWTPEMLESVGQPVNTLGRETGSPRWSVVEPATQGELTPVYFLKLESLQLLASLTATLAVGLSLLISWHVPQRVLAAFLVTLLLAMLAPYHLVPISSALVSGVWVATLFQLLRCCRVTLPPPPNSVSNPGSTASLKLPTLVLGFALGTASFCALAQSQESTRDTVASPEETEYQVLIPLSDAASASVEESPAADYYYVPRPLYQRLHEFNLDSQGGRGWLLRSANYELTFRPGDSPASRPQPEVLARLGLEVFQGPQQILLPMGTRETVVEVRLNDRALVPVWTPDQPQLSLLIDQQGTYQLEVKLRPVASLVEGRAQASVPIPPAPNAVIRYAQQTDPLRVRFPRTIGSLALPGMMDFQEVQLGPVDELQLQWNRESEGADALVDARYDQHLWLRVRPNSVTFAAQLNLVVVEGPLNGFEIEVDPRLRMIPLPPDARIELTRSQRENGRQRLSFRSKEPVTRSLSVQIEFLVTETSGVGRLAFPDFRPLNLRQGRTWAALTVADELDYVVEGDVFSPSSDPAQQLSVADFLSAWGDAESAPNIAFRAGESPLAFAVSTQPKQPQTTSRQSLDLTVGRQEIRAEFRAELETRNGTLLQHRMSLPPGFEIHDLKLLQDDNTLQPRWAHVDESTITVFLPQTATGNYQLQLRGVQRIAPSSPAETLTTPAPLIWLRDVTVKDFRVRVYRQADTLVSFRTGDRWTAESNGNEIRPRQGWARFETELSATTASLANHDFDLAMILRPNRADAQIVQVTSLLRESGQWVATVDLSLSNSTRSRSQIDLIELEIPEIWTELTCEDPSVELTRVELPGTNRQYLVIWPQQPITGEQQLRLRGKLDIPSDERVAAPDIVPRDVRRAFGFVVLPKQLDQQQITWETSRLRATALPENLRDRIQVEGTSYRTLWPDRPRAVIADVQRVSSQRQISLTDIHLFLDSKLNIHGEAHFDIESVGSKRCVVCIQGPYQLKAAYLEETPTQVAELEPGRWQVTLGPDQLPQRLSILFQGKSDAGGQVMLQAPRIEGYPVARTLWTLHSRVPLTATGQDSVRESFVTAVRQESVRLRSMSQVVTRAADVVLESPPADVANWYLPWARRIQASQWRLQQEIAYAAHSTTAEATTLETVRQQQEAVASRLAMQPAWTDMGQEAPRFAERDVTMGEGGLHDSWFHYHTVHLGAQNELQLARPDSTAAPDAWHFRLVVGLLAGIGLLIYGRWPMPQGFVDGVQQRPYLGLAFAALFLVLAPLTAFAALGWCLMLISIVAGLYCERRLRMERLDGFSLRVVSNPSNT